MNTPGYDQWKTRGPVEVVRIGRMDAPVPCPARGCDVVHEISVAYATGDGSELAEAIPTRCDVCGRFYTVAEMEAMAHAAIAYGDENAEFLVPVIRGGAR